MGETGNTKKSKLFNVGPIDYKPCKSIYETRKAYNKNSFIWLYCVKIN